MGPAVGPGFAGFGARAGTCVGPSLGSTWELGNGLAAIEGQVLAKKLVLVWGLMCGTARQGYVAIGGLVVVQMWVLVWGLLEWRPSGKSKNAAVGRGNGLELVLLP